MSDVALRQDVIDELEFEPSIDAANIGVAVEKGVVTLTGHVPTFWQKTAVEKVVGRVKGVRGIVEEIEVRLLGLHSTSDGDIAHRALQSIDWDVAVPKGRVQVSVDRGWVTLSGSVDWKFQRDSAANCIHALTGVRGVTNDISLSPTPTTDDVRHRISEALKRSAELEAQSIQVSVANGRVELKGKVRAWAERSAAEKASWSAGGVRAVDNKLVVI